MLLKQQTTVFEVNLLPEGRILVKADLSFEASVMYDDLVEALDYFKANPSSIDFLSQAHVVVAFKNATKLDTDTVSYVLLSNSDPEVYDEDDED